MKGHHLLSSCLALLVGMGCGEIVPVVSDGDPAGDLEPGLDAGADPCTLAACTCESDAECGPHQYCDSAGPGRRCACVAGYVAEGGGCVWGVAPPDPGFQDSRVWQSSGGARVNPVAEGRTAAGAAFFDAAAVCALGAVHQIFDMPPRDRAEPFVVTVEYRSLGKPEEQAGLALGLNGAWRDLPASAEWRRERFCLGESAYGGAVELRVAPAPISSACAASATTAMIVDHVVIEPAAPGECPAPGEVVNGDFEGGGGWIGTGTGDGGADIADGAGAGGTRAARLFTRTLCSSATLSGLASWPAAATVPGPAVEFWWTGNAGRELVLSTGGRPIAHLRARDTPSVSRVCLPPWAQGQALELTWSLPGTSGACTNQDERDFYVDDIRVVDEPGCGTDPYLLDGGFELTEGSPLPSPWRVEVLPDQGTAAIVSDGSRAHGGAGHARLELFRDCAAASVETVVLVPRPQGLGGPALGFWYDAGDNPETSFHAMIGLDGPSDALPEGGGWAHALMCLPPGMAGRPLPIGFRLDAGDGACTEPFPREVVRIDDVALTLDPRCPG